MCPHPLHADNSLIDLPCGIFELLCVFLFFIHKSVLKIDPSGIEPAQVPDELLLRRRILKRVFYKDI